MSHTHCLIAMVTIVSCKHSFESLHKFWGGAKETEVVISEVC